jgi:hypothetical protein
LTPPGAQQRKLFDQRVEVGYVEQRGAAADRDA